MTTNQTGRIILVTNHLEEDAKGGREMLCRLNHDVLEALYPGRLLPVRLDPASNPSLTFKGLYAARRGYINGVTEDAIEQIAGFASEQHKPVKVFIDGSNLGAVARGLKGRLPRVEIITFFHNVEARFFLGSVRRRRSFHSAAVLAANYVAERAAVRYSDKRICLSQRDSRLLQRVYGQAATHVSAMALKDGMSPPLLDEPPPKGEPFALFVGGAFYANRQGIEWYAAHVARHSDVKVIVIGRGLEALRPAIEVPGKVEVIGAVDDLSGWYRRALFVIAPILDGSGMKTKVAEALMFGKKVVGTPEAFSGYEASLPQAGWICESAADFAGAMRLALDDSPLACDPALRQLYLETYSEAAARRRMEVILNEVGDRT